MATAPPDTITGKVQLRVAGDVMTVEVTVPAGPAPVTDMLPLFNGLASALVERAVERHSGNGHAVSCRAGCGACCRQPVPIAPSEARAIAALVDAMPEPRRSVIRARFADGVAKLDAAGVRLLIDDLRTRDASQRIAWVGDYMRVQVACPFLEAESCSIYPDRPTICREYLVTSPPENCREPTTATIAPVPIPGAVSAAVAETDREIERHGPILLADSLDWVAANPPPVPVKPGPAIVEAVFATLARDS